MGSAAWEPDLFGAVSAAAAGVARILRMDAASAVLFWGKPPEIEVVHKDGLPDPVTHALSVGGGAHLVDVARRAGRPIRVGVDTLPQGAASLAAALRAHAMPALALFPLFGEMGIVGCLVVPLDEGAEVHDAVGHWRAACRALAGLQVAAGATALRALLDNDRRRPLGLCDGVVVVDRWERVLLVDGILRDLPGWNGADPFGRSLYQMLGGPLLANVKLSKPGAPAAEEHVFPPAEHHGIPVAITALPGRLVDGRLDGSRVFLVRDLRAQGESGRDGTARVLALGIRVAHAADEFVRGAGSPDASGVPAGGVLADLLNGARAVPELVRTVLRETAEEDRGGQVVDLNRAIVSVVDRVRGELDVARVRVFTFLRPDLDPVPGDALEVLGVLRALVGRARESLRVAGGTLTVRTWAEEGWAGVAISDDGGGVAQAPSLARVELLFLDSDGGGEAELEEIEARVRNRGGRFQVECRPKVWNRYTVMLPVERRSGAPAPRSTETRVQRGAGGRLDILVVDDNAALRSVLRRFLERRGHGVTEAVDGDDALTKVSGRRFDRVIVDVQMPGKSGPEFFECLARVAPEMQDRTLFMTGGVVERAVERFLEECRRPAITKPFDMAELVKTLEQ